MKEKLNPFHIAVLIFMNQSAVMVLTVPRLLAEYYGYNGWAALALFVALSVLNIFLISLVYRLGRGRNIFDILEASFPKPLLFPLYMLLALIWTVLGCFLAKEYIFVYQMMDFPTTHPMFFKLLIDIVCLLLVMKGIYSITKASTVFFFFYVWMFLLALLFIRDFEWARLTSFLFQGETDFIKGVFDIYPAFLGLEVCLLLFPYAESNKKFMKAVYLGNYMSVIGYFTVSFICFGIYSLEQLKRMQYPVLDLLSYIRFPFIERMENILYGVLMFPVMVAIVLYTWMSVEALKRVIPAASPNFLAFSLLAFAFGVAWVPDVINEVEVWLQYASYIEEGVVFGLPLFLIVVLLFQRKGNARA